MADANSRFILFMETVVMERLRALPTHRRGGGGRPGTDRDVIDHGLNHNKDSGQRNFQTAR